MSFLLRSLFISFAATLLVWGVCLSSSTTLSPEARVYTVNPHCRVGGAQLACVGGISPGQSIDSGAPAWVNAPADYFFRRARLRGEQRPHWNPYTGSGYPIALDGHNSALSPTQWFHSHVPGDQGRDIVVFVRFALWTFAITWLVSLGGASAPLLIVAAFTAALAPYGAAYVDIAFLDVDLLSPWFLLILFGYVIGTLSLRTAAALSTALGALVGVMAFQQAQSILCIAMGVVALAAAPFTRARSLILAMCLGGGVLAVFPSWLPLLHNLDQFISSRNVQCVAEAGTGVSTLVDYWLRPGAFEAPSAFATLVGTWLLLSTPTLGRFLVTSLLVIGTWSVFGLPHVVCAVPIFSGLRFMRHLVPHLQMLFVSSVGLAIAALSRGLDRRVPWLAFILALTITLVVVSTTDGPAENWLLGSSLAALVLALLAAYPYVFRRQLIVRTRGASRALFETGLALLAFAPLVFATPLPLKLVDGRFGARQLPPLVDALDVATPLGIVQKLSEQQDRRHYSPAEFLFPNWSEAFGILDMLSLQALYPIGYHQLNAGLFHDWYYDPAHGLVPDRFTPVKGPLAISQEFQRVMAVHRVSLLTFSIDAATFAPAPSPYEAAKCHLLGSSSVQGTESYICPEVGRVGYFPGTVGVVTNTARAVEQLSHMSVPELLDTVLLGPEIDLSVGGFSTREPQPAHGRVVSVRRMGDDLTYQLDVEKSGVFVIADTYFRGWTALVNGQPAGISRANVTFKAVNVPVGQVELKLHFTPVLL
jgi:hypothetical protein